MQIHLAHAEWQALRVLERNRNKPTLGNDLRPFKTRMTRNGSFLTKLVIHGLLKVETQNANPLIATYCLTDSGVYAADYGYFEIEFSQYKANTMLIDGNKKPKKTRQPVKKKAMKKARK